MAGVRVITIVRQRLRPWLDGFARRHGQFDASTDQTGALALTAPDGARARLLLPFAPVRPPDHSPDHSPEAPPAVETDSPAAVETFIAHCEQDRRVGVLLVRRGGHAVGIFEGAELTASKVGSTYVQGQTKAGGWSQQRYARRRANQAQKAFADAADDAMAVLQPELTTLQALVCGGDVPAVRAVLADHRLGGVRELFEATGQRVLPVVDPRLRVLKAFVEPMLSITIELNELA